MKILSHIIARICSLEPDSDFFVDNIIFKEQLNKLLFAERELLKKRKKYTVFHSVLLLNLPHKRRHDIQHILLVVVSEDIQSVDVK